MKERLGRCYGNRAFVDGATFLDGRKVFGERAAAGHVLERPPVRRISDVETVNEADELPRSGLIVGTDLAIDERGNSGMTCPIDVVAIWVVLGGDDILQGLEETLFVI